MKPKKIAVVVNMNAGASTERAGKGELAARILTDNVFPTFSLDELEPALRKIIAMDVDIIGTASGDGGLKEFLTRLMRLLQQLAPKRRMPIIYHMPLGTVRNVATTLEITKMDLIGHARHIAALMQSGAELRTMDMYPLKVNDEYCFLHGSALPVNMLKLYNKKKIRGARGIFEVMQAALFNEIWAALTFSASKQLLTKPVRAKVILPGHDPDEVPHRLHTTLMCAAVNYVGLGCNGMPDARRTPGHFMLRSSQMKYWEYVLASPALYLGMSPPKTFDAVVQSAVIKYDEPTETTADGEMREPTLLDVISSGPAIPFLVG